MDSRKCRTFRRSFLLTVFCCCFTCYTWYVISSYPIVTDAEMSIDSAIHPISHPGSRDPSSSGSHISISQQQHPSIRTPKPNSHSWRPGDYAVKLWLPRRIKGRPEASHEDHRASLPSRRISGSGGGLLVSDSPPSWVNTSAKFLPQFGVTSGFFQKPTAVSAREQYGGGTGIIGGGGASTVKRLPQALIIGVKKCGTRALLEFLRLHPDIRATGPETHFFDRFYGRGLEWYRQQMPQSLEGQITMEKTPSYFITREVPQRLHQMSPFVKLIVVVRDPVTRAISDYTQTASKRGKVTPTFDQMTFRNATTGLVDTSWSAIRIGVYSRFLDWWVRYFPLHQLHFVSGETLVSDPAGEMARVQDFLGLKRVITDKHFYFNETKGFPCLKKSEGNGNPHCLGKTKGRTHPEIPASTITRLRDFYRPFNLRFYQMVGRDFGWL